MPLPDTIVEAGARAAWFAATGGYARTGHGVLGTWVDMPPATQAAWKHIAAEVIEAADLERTKAHAVDADQLSSGVRIR